MKDWRLLKVGQKILFTWDEFDGKGSKAGTVVEVNEGYAIARTEDNDVLWIDDDTAKMFSLI